MPSVDKAIKPRLLEAYLALDAFPDARAALHDLKRRGERTAILSNGSPRMLAATVEAAKFSAQLDAILSVDQIQIYKPRRESMPWSRKLFRKACRRAVRLLESLGRHGRHGLWIS